MAVRDQGGNTAGWTEEGTWEVGQAAESAPTAVSVTPSTGAGLTQQFAFTGSSPVGASNLTEFYMYVNPRGGAVADACYLKYIANGQMLYLYNGGSFGSGGQAGSSNTLSSSICSVALSTTTVTANGINLTVSPSITFTGASTGSKPLFLDVVDQQNESSGFVQLGSWTVP
jgi:hypothetical protein